MPYYVKIINGEVKEKVCAKRKPTGKEWIKIDNPADPQYEIKQPKRYNYVRFMKSLLADNTLRPLAKDPYYAALSDSLRDSNWEGVNIVTQMMINDTDSMGTVELFNYFKNKLKNEEGVVL